MSEEALVNTGAVAWPDDFTASVMVRRMQAKLHRWAGGDPSRRFGDLWTPTGFVDTIRSGTMVYEERTGSGTGSQEVHPGI